MRYFYIDQLNSFLLFKLVAKILFADTMKNLVFLTGAGISAESGIKTFRDADGLWEGHDIMEVASFDGFEKNPALVLDFYNQRRKQLLEVKPNKAHEIIADLQQHFNVTIITQNVDDLHERAGSNKIIHLHGELLKARSVVNEDLIYDWKTDILEGTTNAISKLFGVGENEEEIVTEEEIKMMVDQGEESGTIEEEEKELIKTSNYVRILFGLVKQFRKLKML